MVKNPPDNVGDAGKEGLIPVGMVPWRRKWQHTPVFLPGKSHDRGVWRTTVYEIAKIWT